MYPLCWLYISHKFLKLISLCLSWYTETLLIFVYKFCSLMLLQNVFISSSYFLKKLSLNTDFFSLLLSDLCQVWGTSPWVLSQGYPGPSASNNASYCHCCWLPLMVKSYSWSTTHVGHRTWRNQICTDKEASSLLASSHCARRCYTDCWGVIRSSFSQMWVPWTAIMTCVAREMLWGQPTPFCLDLRPKH